MAIYKKKKIQNLKFCHFFSTKSILFLLKNKNKILLKYTQMRPFLRFLVGTLLLLFLERNANWVYLFDCKFVVVESKYHIYIYTCVHVFVVDFVDIALYVSVIGLNVLIKCYILKDFYIKLPIEFH